MFMYSEWVRVWVSDVSVVCVSEGSESEWSEWSELSEVKWSGVEWSGVKWSEWVSGWVSESVSEWVSEWVNEWVSECEWVSESRKRGGDPRDARAYIRLGSAHCATPATQKKRRPKGRQGVHPSPWQCTLSHACHAKEAETQGTPGRTSDPLAVHSVPRLPRKRGGDPRDARAYIRPLGSAHCATPTTQKRRRPKGRQGVHPTPWQCTLCHACHAKEAETQGRQGVHPTPWQCALCHACHAKEAETQGTPGRTSDPLAVHIVPRLPRKRGGDPRDARAYIRALGSAHCATPATQTRRRPKGRQGVHPTPWQCALCHACHAKEAETQGTPGRTSDPLAVQIVPRLPHKRGGDPRDARAYIRPLGSAHCATPATQKRRRPKGRQGVHPTPWQCTLCHACHANEAETQGTPGRTSDPLAVHIVPRLPRKRGGDPRDARAYIRPLGSAHCPTPATQKAHEWVSECVSEWVCEWVRVSVSECEWVCVSECVSEWEWVSVSESWRVSECACVCECVCVSTWVSEWVCEWVRVSECEWVRVCVWVCVCEHMSECVSECVSEWVCEWEWVSECEWGSVSEWVSVCVSECVSEWVCEWVRVSECVWVSEEEDGRAEAADTELKTKTPHVNVGNYTTWYHIIAFRIIQYDIINNYNYIPIQYMSLFILYIIIWYIHIYTHDIICMILYTTLLVRYMDPFLPQLPSHLGD